MRRKLFIIATTIFGTFLIAWISIAGLLFYKKQQIIKKYSTKDWYFDGRRVRAKFANGPQWQFTSGQDLVLRNDIFLISFPLVPMEQEILPTVETDSVLTDSNYDGIAASLFAKIDYETSSSTIQNYSGREFHRYYFSGVSYNGKRQNSIIDLILFGNRLVIVLSTFPETVSPHSLPKGILLSEQI